jgi:hypothetical protein
MKSTQVIIISEKEDFQRIRGEFRSIVLGRNGNLQETDQENRG